MAASLCGVLRAFFGDFLSLLSGMKISLPLSTTGSTDFADMVDSFWYHGRRAHLAPAPCPSARPGVASARATRVEGDRPPFRAARRAGLHKRVCPFEGVRI